VIRDPRGRCTRLEIKARAAAQQPKQLGVRRRNGSRGGCTCIAEISTALSKCASAGESWGRASGEHLTAPMFFPNLRRAHVGLSFARRAGLEAFDREETQPRPCNPAPRAAECGVRLLPRTKGLRDERASRHRRFIQETDRLRRTAGVGRPAPRRNDWNTGNADRAPCSATTNKTQNRRHGAATTDARR